jgi:hypothetical protein
MLCTAVAILYDREHKELLEQLQKPVKYFGARIFSSWAQRGSKASAMAYEVCLGYLWGQETVQQIMNHMHSAKKEFMVIKRGSHSALPPTLFSAQCPLTAWHCVHCR